MFLLMNNMGMYEIGMSKGWMTEGSLEGISWDKGKDQIEGD